MAVIYKITRSDGLEYIGITINYKQRINQHKRSKRFNDGINHHEILFEGTYEDCELNEEQYISTFNTFKKGLNMTLGSW